MAQKKKTNNKKNNKVVKKSELELVKESLLRDYDEENKNKKKVLNETDNSNNKRNIVTAFIVGLLIGVGIMAIIVPDRIAKLENGEEIIVKINDKNITADELYTDMKEYYTVDILLDKIDNIILTKIYPEDNDMKTEINNIADYYISMYETYYGYTEEQFLEANNFKNRDEFLDAIALDYRRNKCLEDYTKSLVTENEINKYYKDSVYGDIETKYISVSGTDDTSKSLAERIINRLNNGESYDDVVEHYGDRITSEDLGYISFDNELDDVYIDSLLALENNNYTTTPVNTDDGYMIILRGESKDKPSLDDVKGKIIDILAKQKQSEDSTLIYKALIDIRKNNGLEIKDTDLSKKYNDYIKTNTSNNE
ncbi:MAG: peptidylprolyl isomerase [Bacilli bacterium]|nr:peptidylprolyl isomerase [Bacilli bacterium]